MNYNLEMVRMAYPSKQSGLYQVVVEDIRKRFYQGAKLPPERVYSKILGVARETLRHCLLRLEEERRIVRCVAGTFVAGDSKKEIFFNRQKTQTIHILLPCPDYTVRAGTVSVELVQWLIRGAMRSAIRHGAQVVTIPVSDTNDPADINWNQLSAFRRNDIVLFVGDWYRKLYPFLGERKCRVGFVLPHSEKIPSCFIENHLDCRGYSRPFLANYLPEVFAHLSMRKVEKTAILLREQYSLLFQGKDVFRKSLQSALKNIPSLGTTEIFICDANASLAEQCRFFRNVCAGKKFDAVIFDAEVMPEKPHSLHRALYLPDSVSLYVKNKLFLTGTEKQRGNIFYSRSPLLECGMELAEYFLAGNRKEPEILDFSHIIMNEKEAQNETN